MPFDLMGSYLLGIARGASVQVLIYPLERIKMEQQNNHEKCYRTTLKIFKQEGPIGFYRGLGPQLLKIPIKSWVWPMISGFPSICEGYSQQVLTGFAIASLNASLTTPLEKAKFFTVFNPRDLSWNLLCKQGWTGFFTHWSKLFVNWSTFLVAQKYFRERSLEQSSQEKLTLSQLAGIGIQVATIVSIVSAPFDFANTIRFTQNLNFFQQIRANNLSKMFRGWPLNFASLIIHNIASTIVIDRLDK